MKMYEWILFDADDTLFTFDSFKGLQRMFLGFALHFTEQNFQEYQVVNQALWLGYQNGTVTAQQLKYQRFKAWGDKLGVSPQVLNDAFLRAMHELCTPLDGAISLLNTLRGKVKLGIITNGFSMLQQERLQQAGLQEHFDLLIVSEEVGFAKPHPQIFEHSLSLMGNPQRGNVLMVGDNPDTDILGGQNAGLDTCWYNSNNKPMPAGITPSYQISTLDELETLLLGQLNPCASAFRLAEAAGSSSLL